MPDFDPASSAFIKEKRSRIKVRDGALIRNDFISPHWLNKSQNCVTFQAPSKISINQSDMASNKNRLENFREHRKIMNEKVIDLDHLGIKRFFNLDSNTYKKGALSSQTKELLGLVASAVLRCNDCIDYHLEQCAKTGSTKEEIVDALNVALVVGGSIVIPHLRHAIETIELLQEEGSL